MNFLIIVVAITLAVAAEEPITTNYHEAIGISEATRIWLAERAQDFDGTKIVGGQASALGANPHLVRFIKHTKLCLFILLILCDILYN